MSEKVKTNIQHVWMNATVVQAAEWKDSEDGIENNGHAFFIVQNVSYVWRFGSKTLSFCVLCYGKSGHSVAEYLKVGRQVSLCGQLTLDEQQGLILVVPSVELIGQNQCYNDFEIDSFYRDLEQVNLEQDAGSDWRRATRRGFNAQGAAKDVAKDAGANAHTHTQQVQEQKADEKDISHEQVKSFLAANNIVGEVARRFYAVELKSGWFKDLGSAQANFRRKLEKERFIFADLRKIMQIAKELVSAKSKRGSADRNSMPVLVEDENGESLMMKRSVV